jgi:hypothetical protein
MYTDAQYVWSTPTAQSIKVYIDGVLAYVPIDPANTDYSNMMVLVAEGKLVLAPAEALS